MSHCKIYNSLSCSYFVYLTYSVYFHFRWGWNYRHICLQSVAKAKSERDSTAAGPLQGVDYDLYLHYAIGHMCRVDGALPDFADGTKAFDVEKETTGTYFEYFTYYVYYAYSLIIYRFRYILHKDQPVHGFWYYFMIHSGISTLLQQVLPKYIPRTGADVDQLLGCKVSMQVDYLIYSAYLAYLICIDVMFLA